MFSEELTVEWELERVDHVPKGFISRIFDKFMVNLKNNLYKVVL